MVLDGIGTLEWIALGIAIYTIVAVWADRRGLIPEMLGVEGPFLTVHTQRGVRLLDRIAAHRRAWRAWGNLGVGVAVVVMAGTFVFLLASAVQLVRNPPPPTSINQPRNVLVIPGVNDFLPLSVAPEIVAGLLVGLIVHEGGHGILCRVADIEIESMGLALLAVIPIGAFVEPDEESRDACDRGGQTRMFAAGVMNNFAITVVAFALFFGPVVGAIAVAPGAGVAGVHPGGPADRAGLDRGDRITAVDGTPVANASHLVTRLNRDRTDPLPIRIDGTRDATIDRRLVVAERTRSAPLDVPVNETITAVNGSPVDTIPGFRAAVSNRSVARVATKNGTVVAPIGVLLLNVSPGGALNTAGVPTDGTAVVTRVAGDRTVTHADLDAVLDGTRPGDTVTVETWVDGERTTRSVTLEPHPTDDHGALGVRVVAGTSGVQLTDVGVRLYPAERYLGLLNGDRAALGAAGDTRIGTLVGDPIGRAVFAIFLPVLGFYPGFTEHFAGFTGGVQSFYVVHGPLGALGEGAFVLANLLFWVAWINLQLGFFNCIPGYPLDGGHILRTGTEAILARLPIDPSRSQVRVVTTGVGLTMLCSLLLTLFGPRLL